MEAGREGGGQQPDTIATSGHHTGHHHPSKTCKLECRVPSCHQYVLSVVRLLELASNEGPHEGTRNHGEVESSYCTTAFTFNLYQDTIRGLLRDCEIFALTFVWSSSCHQYVLSGCPVPVLLQLTVKTDSADRWQTIKIFTRRKYFKLCKPEVESIWWTTGRPCVCNYI